jgi:hypothetical protein
MAPAALCSVSSCAWAASARASPAPAPASPAAINIFYCSAFSRPRGCTAHPPNFGIPRSSRFQDRLADAGFAFCRLPGRPDGWRGRAHSSPDITRSTSVSPGRLSLSRSGVGGAWVARTVLASAGSSGNGGSSGSFGGAVVAGPASSDPALRGGPCGGMATCGTTNLTT